MGLKEEYHEKKIQLKMTINKIEEVLEFYQIIHSHRSVSTFEWE
jgi:hypothetical protein